MFTQMRRQDRELTPSETEDILTQGSYGVLSINGGDDYAYGVPLSYVYQGAIIYFHCALEGKKLTRIRQDNRVSFCVVGEAIPMTDKYSMRYKSIIAFGRVREVDGEEKMAALLALVAKYACDQEYLAKGKEHAVNNLAKTVVLRMDLERLSGKARR
jgi:nitroimidazol reductase NimA-like FMN-containing flavoprotein (pyridoxamine 5'-phosphate oxidase superfamily)